MGTDYAAVARLLASPARSAVVDALMHGRPLAAGELARAAGVRPSTVSEYLTDLVDARLLEVVSTGRHRYYQLASADVAYALEAFSRICPATPVRSLRQSAAQRSMQLARLCYDHLAGALGVALLERMLLDGWLTADAPDERHTTDFAVTPRGARRLAEIGVDVDACRRARRHLARSCLDWTHRQPHLAGALGAAIAKATFERNWVRQSGTARGVEVTGEGERLLHSIFEIDIGRLAPTC